MTDHRTHRDQHRRCPRSPHVDPFCPDVLEDPLPFQAALRDAGPVVHLTRYDVYAHGPLRAGARRARRLAGVPARRPGSACRTSATRSRGVRRACCSRPTRRTTTPRAGCSQQILGPRALRRLRERWFADAEELVDALLAGAGPVLEFDAMPALAEAFPLRVFPDAVGIPPRGPREPAALRRPPVQRVRPAQRPGGEGRAARRPSSPGWVNAQCAREVLTDDGFGAADLGRRRPRRHHPRAGAAGGALAAVGRRRHHRPRPRGRAATRSPPTPTSGSGCAPTRRWRGWRSTRRSAGSRRCRRSSAPPTADVRVGDTVVPDGAQDPHVPRRPPTATPGTGTTPTPSTSTATPPGTSASAWASTSASASTSPGSRPRRC